MWLCVPPSHSSAEAGVSTSAFISPAQKLAWWCSWRGKPTPLASWLRAWRREAWLLLLSGVTCRLSTVLHGADAWISSLAVFPAKTSATPESAQASPASGVVCGNSTPASSTRFGPSGCSSRTSLLSSSEDSTLCSAILPRSGSMRNGVVSARAMSARPTRERECSSWPTARASEQENRTTKRSPSHGTTHGRILAGEACEFSRWGTPTARDWKDGADPSLLAPTNGGLGRQAPRSEIVGAITCTCPRTLNPLFVEALMGWPEGWSTARIGSASSVTEWFRRWRQWLFAN